MSDNLRLIENFLRCFHQYDQTDLSHFASESFIFTVNSKPPLTFKDFVKQNRFFFFNTSVNHGSFSSADDKKFQACVEFTSLKYGILVADVIYEVDKNLLQSIEIDYHMPTKEFDKLYEIFLKSYEDESHLFSDT